jgi:serine/threonine protein kinase
MDKVGRYRMERRLGAGSFATVWLGHDDELDVPVAVKVLAENWADNDDVRSRFLAEARIMRRIRDPRLVQVYDIGTLEDGRPYFVMDYIDGGSLNELRKANSDPIRALRLCAEACRAIDVLHENDIIHRDVTPGNLLLAHRPNGQTRVLVADLGVAKSMIDAVGATMTAGTPSYMAPEQAAGVVQLDRRVDIYSLTAVTYAMLTGGPPFPVTSIADIIARPPDIAPAPIAERVGAPQSLDSVMLSGLAADRDRRPPTALLLAEALDTLATQMLTARATLAEQTTQRGSIPDRTAPPASRPASPATAAPPQQAAPHQSERHPPAQQPVIQQPAAAYASPESSVPAPYPGPEVATTERSGRSVSSYVLLALAALALFALSMFVTILALN